MFKKLSALTMAALLVASFMPKTNAIADTTNLFTNPSLETASGSAPANWANGTWGTATTTNSVFSYLSTGHTGTKSIKVEITSITGSGGANWYQTVPVTAGQQYQLSDWYQSNVATEADVEFLDANGTQLATNGYLYLGNIEASTDWKQFSTTFTVPAGAVKATLMHQIYSKGYLITDDYSLTSYAPVGFNQAMVSVTFDDGWKSQISTANYKAMTDNNIPGTYYIISASSANPTSQDASYMTPADVKKLSQDGHEIGSHTVHHCDLSGQQTDDATLCPLPISSAQVTSELADSQAALQTLIGKPVTDFAYPYGGNTSASAVEGAKYYQSLRTVNQGFNTKDNFDALRLKMYEVDQDTTVAQVQAWVDEAIAQKAWLILTYHEINTSPIGGAYYNATPTDFATHMAYINSKRSQITPLTVANALASAKSQISGVTPTPTPTPTATPTPTPTPTTKPGDLNGDNTVDALDLSTLLTNWNKTGMTAAQGDINKDGIVDALDLSVLLTNWSK